MGILRVDPDSRRFESISRRLSASNNLIGRIRKFHSNGTPRFTRSPFFCVFVHSCGEMPVSSRLTAVIPPNCGTKPVAAQNLPTDSQTDPDSLYHGRVPFPRLSPVLESPKMDTVNHSRKIALVLAVSLFGAAVLSPDRWFGSLPSLHAEDDEGEMEY